MTTKDFVPLDCWDEIVERFKSECPSAVGFLSESRAFIYENMILIIVKDAFDLKMFKLQIADVNRIITDFFGRKFKVSVKAKDTSGSANGDTEAENNKTKSASPVKKLIEKAKSENIDIEIK